MHTRNLLTISLASIALLLPGCGAMQAKQDVRNDADGAAARAKAETDRQATIVKNNGTTHLRQQEVDVPWIAGKSVALAKDVTLPNVLRKRLNLGADAGLDAMGRTKITALSNECNPSNYTLQRLASCITALVGVPVRVRPDALLSASQFGQRSAGGGAVAAATPVNAGGMSTAATLSVAPVDMQLSNLLDLAAATWSVKYRLAEDGVIEFYRTETRVLRLKALAQKVTNTTTQGTGFASESKTTIENTATDVLASMRTSLLALGTTAGSIDINPDSKAVIVTDTPEAIARIETYIDSENKRLGRRVTLVVEELFVTDKNSQENAINWSLLYAEMGEKLAIASPASLASSNAGSIGATSGSTKLNGSTAILQALDEKGLAVTRRTYPLSTTNGNSISIGLPTIFDYVAQVTNNAVTGTTGTVSAPTVTQKDDKYGAFLTVTPDAQDDGQILLSVNLSDRTGTLTPYTVQVSGAATTVQQRNIQEATLSTRTIMRSGTTHLIGGLDESQNSATARRLDANAPILLGGSDSVAQNKRRIILLVTAVVEDNI